MVEARNSIDSRPAVEIVAWEQEIRMVSWNYIESIWMHTGKRVGNVVGVACD